MTAGRLREILAWCLAVGLVAVGVHRHSRQQPAEQAVAAFRAGAMGDALRLAFDRLDVDQTDAVAARIAGLAFCARHDPVRAERWLRVVEARGLVTPDDRTELALAFLRAGRNDEAERRLRAICEARTAPAIAIRSLAGLLQMQGRNEEARPVAERLAAIPEEESFARALLSMIDHEARLPGRSVADALRVLELDPALERVPVDPEVFWADLTSDLILIGDPGKASRLLRREIQGPGGSWADRQLAALQEALGLAEEASGQAAEAEQAWLEAYRLDSTRYRAALGLGRLSLREGRAAESVDWLMRASKLDPEAPEPYYALSRAFRQLGRTSEADEAARDHEERLRRRPPRGGMGSQARPVP